LALGDSVPFGLNPTLLVPGQPFPPASSFVGYPEILSQVGHLISSETEINASCPGETSTSFLTGTTPDYGCHSNGPQGQPPFQPGNHLHTNYSGSQLTIALTELASNSRVNLVTLQIGSNDILLLLAACSIANPGQDPTPCINAGLPGVLGTVGTNLANILTSIRAEYNGTLVVVGYYAPSADLIPIAQALNTVIAQLGPRFHIKFADGFTAFQVAAIPFGGDVCKAGLLIHLTPTTCDIHPSPLGQGILAATVLASIAGLP
jgi:lysophospholipase L1-like esterase